MPLALQSLHIKNFKAIQDSKTLRLTPLTALIGYNGVGKSSLVESIETLHSIIERGLDAAMQPWRGFEYIRNQRTQDRKTKTRALTFALRGSIGKQTFGLEMAINTSDGDNELFIEREYVTLKNSYAMERDETGIGHFQPAGEWPDQASYRTYQPGVSIVSDPVYNNTMREFIQSWQFLALNSGAMGNPLPAQRAGGVIKLARDGSNIAEYLLNIRRLDQGAFEGIIETLQYVLPYARDLQPTLTSELERTVYLQLTEGDFKIPGWLLSTGTLRILALLAVLRHPVPAPLVVIEEIENGLDPRTIHLIVGELQRVIDEGQTQVIITTHSPYLLDLLDLSQIVLVERIKDQPVFSRPGDQAALQAWAEKFSPGQLYTMSKLQSGDSA